MSQDENEKQLLNFCTASVDLYARSIIDPGTISADNIQKDIQSFASKMDKSKAHSVGKILFCLELQYRNAAVYERFISTRKKVEDAIEEVNNAAESIRTAEERPVTETDLQRYATFHAELVNLADNYLKYYRGCFPLRHRVRYAPARLSLSPICSYSTDQFAISASDEYLLLDKQRSMWKVQARDKNKPDSGVGPEVLAPSLFFFMHWLPEDANVIERLLTQLRSALGAYMVALATHFRKMLQQEQLRSSFSASQLKELSNLVAAIPEDSSTLTKPIVAGFEDALAKYVQRAEYPDMPQQEKPIVACLSSILAAVRTYAGIPDTVPDRSQVVFNRRLRVDEQKESKVENDKLVHVEWKMELMVNKCLTTTETTEIIPKHVDVDRFKQTEQETERKMVIQAVVDPQTDKEISLNDAVQRGIVDYNSGTYNDKVKGVSITIDEAIMQGLIQVDFVAVKAGEEKQKSYGIMTVKDPATNTETHYVVHVAIDRKSNERLNFDEAVERKILNLENSWFWDSLDNEALPISDALDKGYLKGRKVDNVNEIDELSKSQAEIVKTRFKKVTARVVALKGFRKSMLAANGKEANGNGANGNGTNGHANGTNGNSH